MFFNKIAKKVDRRHTATYNKFVNQGKVKKIILKQAKENDDIIYGARSIQRQIHPLYARKTVDWDIYTKNPKKSAIKSEKALDRATGGDNYYVKKGMFPGLYKVMDKGYDAKKGTEDDIGIIDFGRMPKPMVPTTRICGIRYSTLGKEKKAKQKALKDKTQQFRWSKDREDLIRINLGSNKIWFGGGRMAKRRKSKRRRKR